MRYLISLPLYTYSKDVSSTYVAFGIFVLNYSIDETHIKQRNELRRKQQVERIGMQRLQSKERIQAHKKEAEARYERQEQENEDHHVQSDDATSTSQNNDTRKRHTRKQNHKDN